MADRTSAYIFGYIFEQLNAGHVIDPEKIWQFTHEFDFHPCQMGVDADLIRLDLATECEECGCMLYGPEDEREECEECEE